MHLPSQESTLAQDSHFFAFRGAEPSDDAALARVYNHYVSGSTVTFEEAPIASEDMRARIADADGANLPFLVADARGELIGFAQASKWKGRCAYRYTAETTIYVGPEFLRRGVGVALYARLLASLQSAGIHAAIGGIALPNEASIALHERLGFSQVARFREVGFKFGRWIDVGYWQRVFN